jgi:hypothetical protein
VRRLRRALDNANPVKLAVGAAVTVLGGVVLILLLSTYDLPLFQLQATMHPRATLQAGMVSVAVTTDLPDGAVVACYVVRDQVDISETKTATVERGAFALDLPLPAWTSGSLELDCVFGTAWAEQPRTVIDQIGAQGERLGGPQVFVDAPGVPKELFVGVDLGSIGPGGSPTRSTAP